MNRFTDLYVKIFYVVYYLYTLGIFFGYFLYHFCAYFMHKKTFELQSFSLRARDRFIFARRRTRLGLVSLSLSLYDVVKRRLIYMAKVTKKERANFKRTVMSKHSSNLAKRIQPRGGLRR